MSAPGTPKASEAAIEAVQNALGCERTPILHGYGVGRPRRCCQHGGAWTERGCPVAVTAADAAAPWIAGQTLRDFAHNDLGNQTAARIYEDLLDKAYRIEATDAP